MWDNKAFVTLGIEYQEHLFNKAKNMAIYSDYNFPPTKPIKGGLWGSPLWNEEKYKSPWERYIYGKLNKDMFEHKLNKKSTKFVLKDNANVLSLRSFQDIWIEWEPKIQTNLPIRYIPIANGISKQFAKHLYLNFEDKYYDAIYVSQEFIDTVEYVLSEFERRTIAGEDFDEDFCTALYFAEMFEDWSVESVLVLNKDIISILI